MDKKKEPEILPLYYYSKSDRALQRGEKNYQIFMDLYLCFSLSIKFNKLASVERA
jgi:hypothetical protein